MTDPIVEEPDSFEASDDFDQELADSYVGQYVLVSLNIFEANGEYSEQVHMHGVIISARPGGISVRLGGSREGEIYILAPILSAFEPEGSGFYELNNGDTVDSPDLLGDFKVTKAAKQ